jgi:hypothetical protein
MRLWAVVEAFYPRSSNFRLHSLSIGRADSFSFKLPNCPEFKLRAKNPSHLKTTQLLIFSPMQEDLSYETGVLTPSGLWLSEKETASTPITQLSD